MAGMKGRSKQGGTVMKRSATVKSMVTAIAVALASIGGITAPAQAVEFNAGDAVLVLYGNNTEYYHNLGSMNTLATAGINLTLSPSVMSAVGGTNAIEYTIVGITGSFTTGATDIFAGSSISASNTGSTGWTLTRRNQIVPSSYFNALNDWRTQVQTITGPSHTLAASDGASFTTWFGTADRLAAAFPVRMSSDVDQILYLIGRPFAGTGLPLNNLGTALLTAGGQFSVAPVPVPAAAVLFATGVVGLIGVARRRLTAAGC